MGFTSVISKQTVRSVVLPASLILLSCSVNAATVPNGTYRATAYAQSGVTASGELPRVVGPAGRVVPEGDIPALVAALADLAADPAARARLGRAARARVLACYTPAHAAALYAAAYDEVMRDA